MMDLAKLPKEMGPEVSCNGDYRRSTYVRYRPHWWSLRCQHRATTLFLDNHTRNMIHPAQEYALQGYKLDEETVWLVTAKCLVCGKLVLEGRKETEYGESLGTLYVLKNREYRPPLKDVPDADVLAFWKDVWHFTTQHLGDFNKTTVAIAVAATVYFDNDPLFYSFIVACYLLIAVYASGWIAQWHISRQYYNAVGKKIQHDYKSSFDSAAKYLQGIYILAVLVVVSLMIPAHMEKQRMEKLDRAKGDKVEKTRPLIPSTVVPMKSTPPSKPQPPADKK